MLKAADGPLAHGSVKNPRAPRNGPSMCPAPTRPMTTPDSLFSRTLTVGRIFQQPQPARRCGPNALPRIGTGFQIAAKAGVLSPLSLFFSLRIVCNERLGKAHSPIAPRKQSGVSCARVISVIAEIRSNDRRRVGPVGWSGRNEEVTPIHLRRGPDLSKVIGHSRVGGKVTPVIPRSNN